MGATTNIEEKAQRSFDINMIRPYTVSEFKEFCLLNKNYRIERLANGNILVMPPTHTATGGKNASIFGEIFIWNKASQLGKMFDSSTGFTLPNQAIRAPDVSWIEKSRWDALPQSERDDFAAICPDFVVELRSNSDNLLALREKMEEYIANGCRLAWLVDTYQKQTMVYSPDGSVLVVPFAQVLDGGTVMPGLQLTMAEVLAD